RRGPRGDTMSDRNRWGERAAALEGPLRRVTATLAVSILVIGVGYAAGDAERVPVELSTTVSDEGASDASVPVAAGAGNADRLGPAGRGNDRGGDRGNGAPTRLRPGAV